MAWSKSTRISIMLGIDAAFLVLELGTGIWVGSLALMADAFHMVSRWPETSTFHRRWAFDLWTSLGVEWLTVV